MTNKLYTQKYEDDADTDIRNKFHNRSRYIIKLYLIPMVIVTVLGIVLVTVPFTRSSLCSDLILLFDFKDTVCGDDIDEMHYIFGGIFSKIYLLLEIGIFIHLLKLAFRYPIENDKFYLKREFISIFVIWYITHNILYGILNIGGVIVDYSSSYYISTFRNVLLSIVYATTTYLRKDMNNPPIVLENAHTSDVNCISWNNFCEFMIASGGDDGSFKVWDIRYINNGPISNIQWHKGPITALSWDPFEDSQIAVSSEDNNLSIWDFSVEPDDNQLFDSKNNPIPQQLLFLHQGQNNIKDLKFHPYYKDFLVSTAEDGINVMKPNFNDDESMDIDDEN